MRIVNQLTDKGLAVGVVLAKSVTVEPSPAPFRQLIEALITERKAQEFPGPALKEAVRALLRTGGFKPSGRSKPASEYLAQAAREDRFPFVNNLVDANNYVSLLSGLPISLLDQEAFAGEALLRFGQPGEKYVFNSANQEIDLNGLICACRAEPSPGAPLGNPVKDSMEAKLKDTSKNVVGFLFSPASSISTEELRKHTELLGALIKEFGGAKEIEVRLV